MEFSEGGYVLFGLFLICFALGCWMLALIPELSFPFLIYEYNLGVTSNGYFSLFPVI